tara:strand:+ start:513 stop:956 length:444 start_codon:yes stop_codon:yes gene_type:complete
MKLEIVNAKSFDRKLNGYKKGVKNKVLLSCQKSADIVRNEAVNSIVRGSPSGTTYQKYNPRRMHTASARNQPPASDTGFLANNISATSKKTNTGAEGTVTSAAPYSAFLEFGTLNMAKRPFMLPALRNSKKAIKKIFVKNGLLRKKS